MEFLELLAHFCNTAPVYFSDDLPGASQEKPDLEPSKSVAQFDYLCLFQIEGDSEFFAYGLDMVDAVMQILFARMDKVSVIHISAIATDMQHLFDIVVKAIG